MAPPQRYLRTEAPLPQKPVLFRHNSRSWYAARAARELQSASPFSIGDPRSFGKYSSYRTQEHLQLKEDCGCMKLRNFFYISGMKVLDYRIRWDYISNMFHALAGVSINEASCGY